MPTPTSKTIIRAHAMIRARQQLQTDFCDISNAAAYKEMAHMLDDLGGALPGNVSAYGAFVTALKHGRTINIGSTTTKACTTCGVEKPSWDFHADVRGALGVVAVCIDCSRAGYKTAREKKRGCVVHKCNRGVLKRASNGTTICWLEDRHRHEPIAHMLDDLGFVKPEFKGTYEGLFRLPTADRDARYLEEQMVFVERAAARALAADKRNEDKRMRKATRKEKRDAGVNPLDLGTTVEEILYHRVRVRIRSYCRKYKVSVEDGFVALRGRTKSQYFEQQFGYTTEQFIAHIESLFADGMDWRLLAAGDIHLDHKSPMAIFDIRDAQQLRMCFQLGNMQPLHAAENMSKSSTCDLTGEKIRVQF